MNAFERGFNDKLAQAASTNMSKATARPNVVTKAKAYNGISPTGKPYTRMLGRYLDPNKTLIPANPALQPQPRLRKK